MQETIASKDFCWTLQVCLYLQCLHMSINTLIPFPSLAVDLSKYDAVRSKLPEIESKDGLWTSVASYLTLIQNSDKNHNVLGEDMYLRINSSQHLRIFPQRLGDQISSFRKAWHVSSNRSHISNVRVLGSGASRCH